MDNETKTETTKENEWVVPTPPKEIFKHIEVGAETILNENNTVHILERIDFTDGIKIYVKGTPIPKKGWPTAEAVYGVNQCKRLLIEPMKLLRSPMFMLALGVTGLYFSCLTNKRQRKYVEIALKTYNRLSYDNIRPYILKEAFWTPLASEMGKLTLNFLRYYGIEEKIAKEFSEIVSCIFEYDDAYRFRSTDLFTAVTKEEMIESFRLTVDKMMMIMRKREHSKILEEKFSVISKVLILLSFNEGFNNAFKAAIIDCDFKRLQYDESDKYWIRVRDDAYDYDGKTFKERSEGIDMPLGLEYTVNYQRNNQV